MTTSDNDPKLDYAGVSAAYPVETRIVIEESDGCTRYIDPPGSLSGILAYRFIAILFGTIAAIILIVAFGRAQSTIKSLFFLIVALGFAWGAVKYLKAARQFAKLPTIIEIGRNVVNLTHPMEGHLQWHRSQVKVYCAKPLLLKSRWLNWLVITAEGRQHNMLQSRPADEVEWLADQLRFALQRGEDDKKIAK